MKIFYRIGHILCALCAIYSVQAGPVDSLTVAKVATTYLLQYTPQYEGLTCVDKRVNSEGNALYYVFNHGADKGFIIVTADDACFPILGYATEGRFALDNVPPQLTKLLFGRAAEISYVKREKLTANPEITQFWQRLKYPPAQARLGQQRAITPLLKTKWDQSPYYNDLCPTNAKGQRVVTGCVATAMAQIMKYHNYPKTGQGYRTYTSSNYGQLTANFGNTTYDWAAMPSQLTGRNTAVATLMYHCGVSLAMNYGLINAKGASSSSANTSDVPNVLKTYFNYAGTTAYVERKTKSDAEWIALLKTELDAGRPVQYRGQGSEGGHSFVCDGYTNDNMFHFNWGWSGYYDGNFSVNSLNPGTGGIGSGDGNFNDGQGAVIGIQPPSTVVTSYSLQLTKSLTVSPNPLTFGDDVAVSFNLINQGTASFKGEYCVALFAADGSFVSFLGDIKTTADLPATYTYTSDLVFTQKNLFVSEGTYQIEAFYREPLKEWKSLGATKFSNNVQVSARGVTSDLKMFGTPLQTNATPINQSAPFTVSCNLKNFGTTAFEGDISMDLQALNGDVVAQLEIKQGVSLAANSSFSTTLVFRTTGLNVPVGTYFISPGYKPKNASSYYYPSAYKDANNTYPNLIRVVVAAPALIADKFEPNNTETESAALPLTFANNAATITTETTNLHLDSDLDYYKLDLPTGYVYEITARVHDRNNSANGKLYTADVIFSYKAGSAAYSSVYDVSVNDINDKIKLSNGGPVVFKVAPSAAGETGTYLLDIQVSRQTPPFITLVSPKAGDKWLTTTTQQITWTDNITENVQLYLLRGTANTIIQTISTSAPSNGLFTWTVPDNLPDATDYKVGIVSVTSSSVQAVSGSFSIAKLILSTENPAVTLSPNPTSGMLIIRAERTLPFHTVIVTNSRGQQVLTLTNQGATDRLVIDLSGQAAGVYVVNLVGDDAVRSQKISLIR